jgi:hypothetical protein
MNRQQIKWLFVSCLMVILLIVTVFAVPVKAAAPVITDVNPKVIVNDVNNTLTIDGSGFIDQAEVMIGSEPAVVTYYSATQLIARIPAGFEPGKYSVTVSNPGMPPEPATWSGMIEVVIPTPTPTPSPTFTPTPTLTPAVTGRPQVVIDTYSLSESPVKYNQDFNFNVSLDNAGGSTAYGLQVTFTSTDLLMLKNGGIVAAGDLGVVGKAGVTQTMTLAAPLLDVSRVSLDMTVIYSDEKGTAYTDKFTLFLPAANTHGNYASQPTATPTGLQRAQLVITDYETDVAPLQPGYQFTLSLSVQNVGNITAKGVTMIVGGGSVSGGSGTPQPGGTNGGSGEFTNFAPVGTSNLQSLSDFNPGAVVKAKQQLIVNVSANPGAYPMKISFAYTDGNGNQVNDDQVITLLIYSLPVVDVTFYQPVGELMAGQPGALPLQVTSLGKRSVVLGKMRVETKSGFVDNGEALIGSLDPGGYFTLDSMVTPYQAGPLDLLITIEYTDDFNQVQTITKNLTLNVSELPVMPTPDPNNPNGGAETPAVQQTVWQKIWRFILGLFGLDSSGPSTPPYDVAPTQIPVPIKGGGGKG